MGSAGVGIMFQSFQLIYSYQTGVRRFTDGTNLGVSGNRIQLSGRIGKYVNASLETTNSNFIDDQFIDPWFHNPFERRVNFNLGATF